MTNKILSLDVLLDELSKGSFDCLQPQYRNSIIHYLNEHTDLARSEKEARLAKNKILAVLRNKVAAPHMQLTKLLSQVNDMKASAKDKEFEFTTNEVIDDVLSQVIYYINLAIDEITM